jgi:hypothetical protein
MFKELIAVYSGNSMKHCKYKVQNNCVRFQVLMAASMMFRIVFWDVLPCKIIVDRRFRGASVDNYFTRQYIQKTILNIQNN